MELSKVYNKVAEHYDKYADNFGFVPATHEAALAQLLDLDWHNKSIVDLGVGSGEFLSELKQKFPEARMTGVDISEEMLKLAKKKLGLTTICSSLENVDRHLPRHGFDLVIAHFVLAYVGPEIFFEKANELIKPGGYISLVTTTLDSFPASQKFFQKKSEQKGIVGRIVKYFYHRAMQVNHVPQSFAALQQEAEKKGFTIVKHRQVIKDLTFNHLKETMNFWIYGGWAASGVEANFLPTSLFYLMLEMYIQFSVKFPFTDHFIGEVILLRACR
jgi:ubiquinone/menaquinone biosynthesis C-methylase UbiE